VEDCGKKTSPTTRLNKDSCSQRLFHFQHIMSKDQGSTTERVTEFASRMLDEVKSMQFGEIAQTVASKSFDLIVRSLIVMFAFNYSIPLFLRKDLNLVRNIGFGTALALVILICALAPSN